MSAVLWNFVDDLAELPEERKMMLGARIRWGVIRDGDCKGGELGADV